MASNFTRDTHVLHFGVEPPARSNVARCIAWPAYAYRVLAPAPEPRSDLDVFEEGVLRMLRAGVVDVREIGRLLHLDRRLVAYVMAGLQGRGLCDDHGVPTDVGHRLLSGESDEREQERVVFVFRDAVSPHVWDRFAESVLPYQDPDWPADGWPRLHLGTAGSRRTEWPFVCWPPPSADPPAPSAHEVLDSIRRHARAQRAGSDDIGESGRDAVQRVHYIDKRPTPVFLVTYLYSVDRHEHGEAWSVCDPFGLAPHSPWLRSAVERMAEANQGLAALVDGVGTTQAESESLPDADDSVPGPLPRVSDFNSDISDALLDAEDAIEVGKAIGHLERALMLVFADLLDGGPSEERLADLTGDPRMDSQFVVRCASAAGFDGLPPVLAVVRKHKVLAVSAGNQQSLVPLVQATLLSAIDAKSHPLRMAARHVPSLLHYLADVVDARSRLEDNLDPPSLSEARELIAAVEMAVASLLRTSPARG